MRFAYCENQTINPFLVKGYKGSRYFCNRKRESDTLISAIRNSQDITLFGHRRFGKSALIHHVFQKLQKEYVCIYTYIGGTSSIEELFKFLHQLNIPILFAIDEFQSGFVENPTSAGFMEVTNIRSPSSMYRAVNSLLDKQLIVKEEGKLRMYDVFLEHYLKFAL